MELHCTRSGWVISSSKLFSELSPGFVRASHFIPLVGSSFLHGSSRLCERIWGHSALCAGQNLDSRAFHLSITSCAFNNLKSCCSMLSLVYSVIPKSPCGNPSHLWRSLLTSLKSQILTLRWRTQDHGILAKCDVGRSMFELFSQTCPQISASCCS